jgi:hypothetical protein
VVWTQHCMLLSIAQLSALLNKATGWVEHPR